MRNQIEGRALRRTLYEMPDLGGAAEVFEIARARRRPPDRVEKVRLDLAARAIGLPVALAERLAEHLPGAVERGRTWWVPVRELARLAERGGFFLKKKEHV